MKNTEINEDSFLKNFIGLPANIIIIRGQIKHQPLYTISFSVKLTTIINPLKLRNSMLAFDTFAGKMSGFGGAKNNLNTIVKIAVAARPISK